MADHSTEIAALKAILNAAARSVRLGDLSAQYDLEAARKRLQELTGQDDLSIAQGKHRPSSFTNRLDFY